MWPERFNQARVMQGRLELLNVAHTVQGYEAAGASAIQLEDQEFPKKCGHTPGRRVISIEEAAAKIKVPRIHRPLDLFRLSPVCRAVQRPRRNVSSLMVRLLVRRLRARHGARPTF